jgi:hypothetical protein
MEHEGQSALGCVRPVGVMPKERRLSLGVQKSNTAVASIIFSKNLVLYLSQQLIPDQQYPFNLPNPQLPQDEPPIPRQIRQTSCLASGREQSTFFVQSCAARSRCRSHEKLFCRHRGSTQR